MDNYKDIWDLRKPGQRDSTRHRERIRRAIKENLRELIGEENIISSDGKRKVKVPVRYLDMWRFKYGSNRKQKMIGHGEGKDDEGKIIHRESGDENAGPQAGSEPGEEIYEESVELQEIIMMMLEDLGLPWLEEKDSQVEFITKTTVFHDVSKKGLPPNLDRRRTLIEALKRQALQKAGEKDGEKELIEEEQKKRRRLHQDDLRFRQYDNIIERHSKASVTLIMDRSGSMDHEKRFIVKSFFFWMVNFIRLKYDHVALNFIAHDTVAREVKEESFFSIVDSGGTKVSSGLQLAKEIIEMRHPTDIWNNYVFAFSDGENWGEDNKECVRLVKEILGMCRAVGYGEVDMTQFYNWGGWGGKWSTLHDDFEKDEELVAEPRFMTASLVKRDDVYDCLRKFLDVEDKK
jgi:sporulation protein YhbH